MALKDHKQYPWRRATRILLFVATGFIILLAAPLSISFWSSALSPKGWGLQKLVWIARYTPHWVGHARWGVASFATWLVVLILAIVIAFALDASGKLRGREEQVFYLLRTVARYRLAIGLLAFAALKLLPLQFPAISISDLNTDYGDFLPWKLYYLTNAASKAGYLFSLGLLEAVAGILLLFRRTATVGAILAAFLLTNIVLANFAYQLGDHVYSVELLLLSVIVFARDGLGLFRIFVSEKPAAPRTFVPAFSLLQSRLRTTVRAVVALFFVTYAITAIASHRNNSWPAKHEAALTSLQGLYDVKEFSRNGVSLPYSLTDPVRWQNVVIEPWNAISIRVDRPVTLQVENPEGASATLPDPQRYDYAGNGGRHFYSYTADAQSGTLSLKGESDPGESLQLTYTVAPDRSIRLHGADHSQAVIDATLVPVAKDYLLLLGRRHPMKVY